MRPEDAANVEILARYLDREWMASVPRLALIQLVESARCVEVDSPPAHREVQHEPGDVVVTLDLGPVLLDPQGRTI